MMLKFHRNKKAYTLLELVFVIVVVGIVSASSASVISKVYDNYLAQRAYHVASIKAENASREIFSRLGYSISDSIICRQTILKGGSYKELTDFNNSYPILEWVGYDIDSFTASKKPGWSGVCDTEESNRSKIVTPGSNLALSKKIIDNLGGKVKDSILIFTDASYEADSFWDINVSIKKSHEQILQIKTFDTNTSITIKTLPPHTTIYDMYKIARSAYALVLEKAADSKTSNLMLYYNFQPWEGKQYHHGNKSILVDHVDSFRFLKRGGGNSNHTIFFQLCIQENIDDNRTISSCRESAVLR